MVTTITVTLVAHCFYCALIVLITAKSKEEFDLTQMPWDLAAHPGQE